MKVASYKVLIAGLQYDVVYKPGEEMQGNLGLANFNLQEISINANATTQTQQVAVLHEVLHIISDSYNLKMSEEQVKFLTHGILAFKHDNPGNTIL